MKFRKVFLALAAVGFVAGCKNDGAVSGGQSYLLDSVFSSGFVQSYSPNDEIQAANLRVTPQYSVQNIPWVNSQGVESVVNSLIDSGIEYAHALGLTGKLQTISVVDNGFLVNHEQFSGKNVAGNSAYPNGVDPSVSIPFHGTHVASIAAGNGVGKMIGVAPGAELFLSSNASWQSSEQANLDAISAHAIVQNNSWGLVYKTPTGQVEYDISNSNYQQVFGYGAGASYMLALESLAKKTVIVFAMSNDTASIHAGLLAGLPVIKPQLESSWIAVVNGKPTFAINRISSVTLISSQCLEAAAWCVTANGTNWGAGISSTSAYNSGTGTSYATPIVSGAIALLAQAFPGFSAQALRARLLASANNRFFQNTGYVQFSPSVRHGYNSKFGHGFLDIKAALLPIGGSYIPLSNGGTLDVTKPVLLSGGMVGDAVVTSLSRQELSLTDGMGAGFDVPASVLTAQTVAQYDPIATINGLLAVDLQADQVDPFRTSNAFSETLPGQELNFQASDTKVALLIPTLGSRDANFGISATREFQLGQGNIRLGLSAARESGGFAGLKSMVPGAAMSGTHAAATFDWSIPVGAAQEIRLSGSLGLAMPDGGLSDMAVSNVSYNSLNLTYGAQNVWGAGDRLSVGISMPQAVQSGTAKFLLPVGLSNGQTTFQSADVSLTPAGRQVDLSISYGMPLSNRSEVVMSAVRSLNNGNILGQNTSQAAIGFRITF